MSLDQSAIAKLHLIDAVNGLRRNLRGSNIWPQECQSRGKVGVKLAFVNLSGVVDTVKKGHT